MPFCIVCDENPWNFECLFIVLLILKDFLKTSESTERQKSGNSYDEECGNWHFNPFKVIKVPNHYKVIKEPNGLCQFTITQQIGFWQFTCMNMIFPLESQMSPTLYLEGWSDSNKDWSISKIRRFFYEWYELKKFKNTEDDHSKFPIESFRKIINLLNIIGSYQKYKKHIMIKGKLYMSGTSLKSKILELYQEILVWPLTTRAIKLH